MSARQSLLIALLFCFNPAMPAVIAQGTALVGYPVASPVVQCVFASQCAGSVGEKHTGMDFTSNDASNRYAVYAAGPGKVVMMQVNGVGCTCNHSGCGCQDHGLGNAIILEHTRQDGSVFYTLYAHNASFAPGLAVGQSVGKGTVIATMGGTGYGLSNFWGTHSHFEVKTAATLGSTPSCSTCFGYTPADPTTYGYFNPASYINTVSVRDAQPVQVTDFFQKNSNGQYAITCPTDNLVDAQFKLVNNGSTSVSFPQVAMALHRDSDDSFVADVALQYNVTIPAGGTYQFPRSFLDGTNPNLQVGTYRLVAKIYYNAAWMELSLHLPFTIVSRSNSCGGSSITDPLIVGLASTNQPVRWFYIMNQSTGAWYIVSPTGEQVMFLDRVDKNTSFGIYWRPVNNSSFQTYADASRNFSSVTISADGRTIAFGSAIASTSDPHVSALANTTQPVRWFYIMNQSSGAWYIASPTGQQVMFLDRVDQNTSFGIYWKPINNSSFQSYASAGQNYTSVTISSDGRTVSFGALM